MSELRGVRLSVLRDARGDFTGGGVSSQHADLWLVDVTLPPRWTRPIPEGGVTVRLAQTVPGYWVLEPTIQPGDKVGPMAGGNYAIAKYGTDAQAWSSLLGHVGAIPVHDRFETQEQYDALSR